MTERIRTVNTDNAYDKEDGMWKVKSMQKKFRESFTSDLSKWDVVTGEGTTINLSGGSLVMDSGVVANAEAYILSKETFTIPLRIMVNVGLSQRVVNQQFFIELVSVDPITLMPDGLNCAAWFFDGITATQGKHRVQGNGSIPLDSGASTVITTIGLVGLYEIEPFVDECWFHSKTLDSVSARTTSNVRHQQIPCPKCLYKIRLRWLNSGTAPASSTSASVRFVSCSDYAELTAEITAGRGQTAAGQGMGVSVIGAPTVVGGAAHDAVGTSISPVKIGAQAQNANPSGVSANGDITNIIATMIGVPIVRPYSLPESDWQYACPSAIANTTDVALRAAGGTGIRNYVTGIQVMNTGATATEIVVKDGSTVIWRGHVGASMTTMHVLRFVTPLRGTAATAMNFACIATGANVYVSAQGYQAP